MSELDAVTAERLDAVTDRHRTVLAGALNALALARTNAARSAHAQETAAAEASAELATAAAEAPPEKGGWGRRPDTTEIVVDQPDGDEPAVPAVHRTAGVERPVVARGEEELEGRDWLR